MQTLCGLTRYAPNGAHGRNPTERYNARAGSNASPEKMAHHGSPYSLPSRRLDGVHRLQFGVSRIDPSQRTYSDELTRSSSAVEGDAGVEQALDLECVHVPGRRDRSGIGQML
jgi:hypothetical protein